MRCVLVDERKEFLQDVRTRLVLDDGRDVEICSAITSPEKLEAIIRDKKPDAVVIASNVVEMQEDWDYSGVEVYGYATTKDGEEKLAEAGIRSYGFCKNSSVLLNMMESEPAPLKKKQEPPKKKQQVIEYDDEEEEEEEERPAPKRKRKYEEEIEEDEEEEYRPKQNKNNRPSKESRRNSRDIDEEEEDVEDEKPAKRVEKKPEVKQQESRMQKQEQKKKSYTKKEESYDEDESDECDDEDDNEEEYFSNGRMNRSAMRRKENQKKAKVVTVYAAKGGVGKTTIASNLSVYLGLTSSGRGKLKVCIVDYNIDFGDVRSVLGFPMEGPDMSLWALDIQEQINSGEDPKNIKFSRDEIHEYLQKMERTDVYALLAPLTHEESMDISGEALEIMLRNLVNYGGFDFVICDTGNNTRDSSVYALEFADTVLLVSTTDATTVTCNVSAMEALDKFGLDMNKVKLILNVCMSRKATGISAKEVEDELKYPCLARIPFDVEVIRSNNVSIPIVYQAKHEVTAAFRKIVGFLLGTPAVDTDKPKGLFSKLFKKGE